MVSIAEYFRVQPWVVAVIVGTWALGFVLWGFTGELVCSLAAYVYPVYASFKAVEDGNPEQKTGWLIYWITFYSWCCAEAVAYRLVAWFPGYHLVKLIFILALTVPNAGGARRLYGWVLRPFFQRHRPKVEEAIARSTSHLDVGACLQMAGRATGAAVSVVLEHGSSGEHPTQDNAMQEIMIETLRRDAMAQVQRIKAAGAAAGAAALLSSGGVGAAPCPNQASLRALESPGSAHAPKRARPRASTPPPPALMCNAGGGMEALANS